MFTTTGKVTAVLAVVLLVCGVLLNYPEIVAIGLACVVALLVAAAWIALRPDVVAIRELAPARVTQGERSVARLSVTNRSARRSPPIVAEEVVGEETVTISVPSLAAQATHTTAYELPTERRGIFGVGPLTIGQADPLRLMFVGRSFASRSTLWVYPRVHEVRGVLAGRTSDMEGPTSSAAPQGGVAFHAIRDWVWGDDFRLIHWKSTARTGTLQVRQMVVPDEPRVLVVLDTSSDPYADDSFEDAVRVAASLVSAASQEHYPVVLRTTGGAVAIADSDGTGVQSAMDLLAAVRTDAADPGLIALTQMLPDDRDVSLTVVTGQADARQISVVGSVRSRFQLVSLAQVGEKHGRPASPPAGVVAVNVATSADFAAVWDRLVHR